MAWPTDWDALEPDGLSPDRAATLFGLLDVPDVTMCKVLAFPPMLGIELCEELLMARLEKTLEVEHYLRYGDENRVQEVFADLFNAAVDELKYLKEEPGDGWMDDLGGICPVFASPNNNIVPAVINTLVEGRRLASRGKVVSDLGKAIEAYRQRMATLKGLPWPERFEPARVEYDIEDPLYTYHINGFDVNSVSPSPKSESQSLNGHDTPARDTPFALEQESARVEDTSEYSIDDPLHPSYIKPHDADNERIENTVKGQDVTNGYHLLLS